MNRFWKIVYEVFAGFLIVGVIYAVYCLVCYKIDLYKRKHPGTSTFDYWMDGKK